MHESAEVQLATAGATAIPGPDCPKHADSSQLLLMGQRPFTHCKDCATALRGPKSA